MANNPNIEKATEELKACLPNYLRDKGIQKLTGYMKCFFHSEKTASMKYYNDSQSLYCFGCEKRATIIDLIMQDIGTTDFMTALKYGCQRYGIALNTDETNTYTYTHTHMNTQKQDEKQQQEEQPEQDYTAFYKEAAANLDKTTYHRGLSLETLRRFNVGYVENWINPISEYKIPSSRLIIPISKRTYVARATYDTKQYKYLYSSKHRELFNPTALYGQRPVFITEGELDALSIIDAGGEAVALGGTGNMDKLIKSCEDKKPAVTLLLALDNDKPKEDGKPGTGQTATQTLKQALDKLNVLSIDISTYLYKDAYKAQNEAQDATTVKEYKDANEALNADREIFTAAIKQLEQYGYDTMNYKQKQDIKELQQEASAAGYKQAFLTRVQENREQAAYSTGFSRLDKDLDGGLYPGLYTIGAISSIGKTTFALQIADHIADSGKDVMLFSLEMDKYELMAKSISRLTYIVSNCKCLTGQETAAKTTRAILTGRESYSQLEEDIRQEAISRYFDSNMAKHIYIKEGLGTVSAETIAEAIKEHQEKTRQAPVIIVDYLQILAPADVRATDKQNMDIAVLKLKQLSRDFRTPVVIISSINRTSYNSAEGVTMASFKESGAIEYGSDVLIGLNDESKDSGIELPDTEAKTVKLTVLKNRNGKKDKTGIKYSFWGIFNYFQEDKD